MTRDELVYVFMGVVVAGIAMALLHERHYNGRRERIEAARAHALLSGFEVRLSTVETILMEDRET